MNWREKWAVLKMAGYQMVDHGEDRSISDGKLFRYVCQESPWEGIYAGGDTKEEAVNRLWDEYTKEKKDEKVY